MMNVKNYFYTCEIIVIISFAKYFIRIHLSDDNEQNTIDRKKGDSSSIIFSGAINVAQIDNQIQLTKDVYNKRIIIQ